MELAEEVEEDLEKEEDLEEEEELVEEESRSLGERGAAIFFIHRKTPVVEHFTEKRPSTSTAIGFLWVLFFFFVGGPECFFFLLLLVTHLGLDS